MRAHQIVSASAIPAIDAVAIPAGVESPLAQFTLVYGDVLAAARRNDAAALKTAATQLRALQKAAIGANDEGRASNPTARISAEVMVQEADALLLIVGATPETIDAKRAEALKILEAATQAERSMPVEFGPPVIPKPAAELLGDQLLAAGRASDAASAYQAVLERTPGRKPALEGLLVAQKASGNAEAAERTAKKLAVEKKVEVHVH